MTHFLLLIGFLFSTTHCDIHEEVFSSIYAHAYWGVNAQGEGTSGPGSTPENCAQYTDFLQRFLKEKNITSVVDAGCGDWQFS